MKQAASLLLAASFAAASLPTWVVQPGKKTHFCFANTWPSGLQNILTCVDLAFDDQALTTTYKAWSDPVQKNAYDVCNEDVFNQEVLEIFITSSTAEAKPQLYWEVEVTPKGTTWLGLDSNPGGDRANLTHVLYPCGAVGTAVRPGQGSWEAEIVLPFKLIGRGTPAGPGRRAFRANFFRVQMNPASWSNVSVTRATNCDPSNCTFTCASCPDTASPDFHHSGFFGTIVLDESSQH